MNHLQLRMAKAASGRERKPTPKARLIANAAWFLLFLGMCSCTAVDRCWIVVKYHRDVRVYDTSLKGFRSVQFFKGWYWCPYKHDHHIHCPYKHDHHIHCLSLQSRPSYPLFVPTITTIISIATTAQEPLSQQDHIVQLRAVEILQNWTLSL